MRYASFTLLLLIAAAPASFASSVYEISIDTSSLAPGSTGFIDFALNGAFPATAAIENYANPGGALDPASLTTQNNVTGTLPGEIRLDQGNTDFDEGLTFGTGPIAFQLTLTGTPSGNVGDVFTLTFFNSNFSGFLLTGNVNDGWLAQFQLGVDGSVAATAYQDPSGGPSFASIAPVPEPETFLLTGMALLWCVGRRRPRARQRFLPAPDNATKA